MIGAEGVQQVGIGIGISLEPAVEIVAEAVVPIEFIDQLEQNTRPETVDTTR
jgi:hypothetical protein